MRTVLALALLLWCSNPARTCRSFKNVTLTLVPKTGQKYRSVLNTCMERKAFEPETITEVYAEKQSISNLERDEIRHLRQLRVLSLVHCHIEVLEPALFRDVPLLRLIRLRFNEIREVPVEIFNTLESLEVLDLSKNRISTIETRAFGDSQTLKEVLLGFNQLEEFSGEWFDGSTNLQVVDFQYNKIKEVPRGAFRSWPRLKKICFDYNQLEVIHPEAFTSVSNLRFLGLRHNKLTTLNPRSFPVQMRIEKLMVDANYLNYLPAMLLGRLEVKEICLIGNPWKCPCLDQIHHWLYSINGTTLVPDFCRQNNIPVCLSPPSFTHSCQESVDAGVTEEFLGRLRDIRPPLDDKCARIN